ncbi:S1 family peptidase [Pantanalinema rosaneae CENA516]|uniref:S1 family peptidase n=1 Tax=Pantanalinema rosaneae TaxID=1620701 RepID=UPI003D701EAB
MRSRVLVSLVAAGFILPTPSEVTSAFGLKPISLQQPQIHLPKGTIPEIARQVTVRVFSSPRLAGSGVLIQRQKQRYTVLTCAHVANLNQAERYTVLTPDGQIHKAKRISWQLRDVDLALLEFNSADSYQIAILSEAAIEPKQLVYATGFPNYYDISPTRLEETFGWGPRALRITQGTVSIVLTPRSLMQGYQLGYTNHVELGMSGGAILNASGELVGINGRGSYPLSGIEAFQFTDGTFPPFRLFQQMEPLSWAIPTAVFQQSKLKLFL